ncbi:MAG TPA: DUF5103 domain-containing protein [Chitinophagaceae bacterium]|jgi:hypothetical protein|nr:DUF5103 domain-containing protein [Chitinophagaceae bacterium]
MKYILLPICLLVVFASRAQIPDHIYAGNIRSLKFNVYGNQLAYPVWTLNSTDQMELNFDDMDANVKNYSYTYQLCNADWSPAMLSQFDYIKGFSQMRLNNYRISSIALTKYTHYQAMLPDRSCLPSRSGNYLLKVFLDGDTSRVVFTRRLLVVTQQVTIPAQIQQPFNGQFFKTHQKIQFSVNVSKLNLVNAMQQVSVTILQNNRWDNSLRNVRPTFVRQGTLEYNTETDCLFPGGREWRWLDLRSFRLQSDRVENANYASNGTQIFVKPDLDRSQQRFVFYRDNNGMFYNGVTESINPLWQADFANVSFRFVPPGNVPLPGKDIYLFGELSNYGETGKMTFNEQSGMYETSLFLKQGYYDYAYITTNTGGGNPSFEITEGNFWDTENNYTILVYYRPLGGRADELIGFTRISSLMGRQGIGF